MKKIFILLLLLIIMSVNFYGCNNKTESKLKEDVDCLIKVAAAEDKILQSYSNTNSQNIQFKEKFESYLKNDFTITTFKNEYESKQIILTPLVDVSYYDVFLSDFTSGNNVLEKNCFDIRHEYYHNIETIYDSNSTMLPGMYPDALLPMETAKEYKLNTIKAGENQGVYITVKIPKNQVAGEYAGTIKIKLDNAIKELSARIIVLDYTLPDTVSLKSCIPVQPGYLMSGELEDTQETYDKVVESLKEFRLSAQ